MEKAIDSAVVSCIQDDVLKEFLLKHRTEVLDVCITEFNKEVYENGIREEGIAKGRAEGIAKGRAEGIKNIIDQMLSAGIITPEQAAQFTN